MRQNRDGNSENVVLGSVEKWRCHMHDQHFDKLGGCSYGPEEVVPCHWCCRPCVTEQGQHKSMNRLPFWGSHERVCRENPNKPGLPGERVGRTGSGESSAGLHLPRGDQWAGAQRDRRLAHGVGGNVPRAGDGLQWSDQHLRDGERDRPGIDNRREDSTPVRSPQSGPAYLQSRSGRRAL